MGAGVYVMNTRSNHDNILYDILDKYIMDAATLTKVCMWRHNMLMETGHLSQRLFL